jgi:AcrR family transcriptional regulator
MSDMASATTVTPSRGHAARERILAAATRLFYERGINVTGVDELAAAASVSKRTLYKHFAGKDALIEAYLRRFDDEHLLAREAVLDRRDLPPRERLLSIFAVPDTTPAGARGCPFSNAAVEIAAHQHPVHRLAAGHKRDFLRRLTQVATEAGVSDPELVARQLSILFDGVSAQTVVDGRGDSAVAARAAALALIGEARE